MNDDGEFEERMPTLSKTGWERKGEKRKEKEKRYYLRKPRCAPIRTALLRFAMQEGLRGMQAVFRLQDCSMLLLVAVLRCAREDMHGMIDDQSSSHLSQYSSSPSLS
jgi:hypothetical protein